ncbi:MAG: dimethylarginine dimethylaminohydrolase family protein [Candidatus Aminicenantales bacterium]
MNSGTLSEVAPIARILLKDPRQAWSSQADIRGQWKNLGYTEEPDYERACAEYDEFVGILRRFVSEVHLLPAERGTGLDSIYVRDAACIAPRGLVLCRMGKALRRGEPEAVGQFCREAGWAVAGEIREPGTLEGGDVVWLDEKTVAVGRGYRTNGEGIRQLAAIVVPDGVEVVEAPLPHWDGPGDVLHLMSMLSPVGAKTLLVYSRLLTVPFRKRLLDQGNRLIEVPDEEYAAMATNVLALAPGKCLALAGNPRTAALLEKAGIEVLTYEGKEISVKGAGGPTCLTRPLRAKN